MLNLLFFANMMVASGSVFHPAISINFWLSIVYASMINNRSRPRLIQAKAI